MATSTVGRDRTDGHTRAVVRPAGASLAAGLLLAVLLIRMAWDAGGYFPDAYLGTGTIALLGCAVLLVVARLDFVVSTEALVALVALAGLTLWTGLSSRWSTAPVAAIDTMQRDLMYLGIFGLAVIAAGSGRYSRHLVWLALGVSSVVVLSGLASRLLPGLVSAPREAFGAYRLSYPLTYWNAFGGLAALAAVLALGLACDPRIRWWLRAPTAGLSVLLVTAMALSLSRGSWLAMFAGLTVLVLLSAYPGSLILTVAVTAAGWILAVGRLQSYPALTDDPTLGAGQAAAGSAFLPQLLVIAVAVGGAVGFFAAARSSPQLMRQLERGFRPAAISGLIIACVLSAGAYAARAANIEGESANVIDGAGNWVQRQWDDFMAPAGAIDPGTGAARVTANAGGSRSDVYRVALGGFADNPLRGGGAGSFHVRWLADRPIGVGAYNAHSLEIETLSELGLVGAALLAAFLAAVGAAALRARLKPGALSRSQVAAVGGAGTVWLVHSAVDWDWQIPAFTGVFLMLACAVLPLGRRSRRAQAAGAGALRRRM